MLPVSNASESFDRLLTLLSQMSGDKARQQARSLPSYPREWCSLATSANFLTYWDGAIEDFPCKRGASQTMISVSH